MPATEIIAMPKVAGMARSYVPACTAGQPKDFHLKHPQTTHLPDFPSQTFFDTIG